MKVLLFGASGMIGQGALRACAVDPRVTDVLCVTRAPSDVARQSPKVRELVHPNLYDLSPVEAQLTGFDACLYCLGVSSAGMSEADYTRVTYELTVHVGQTLSRLNPQLTMCFISGRSTDATEQGKVMWARVKGKAENALARMPFKAAYMFRPGAIEPRHGEVSKTPGYRVGMAVMKPFWPLLRRFPAFATRTDVLGRAMLRAAREGWPTAVLESVDINRAGAEG